MTITLISYGLPSLFAFANAAAIIWIKRWVERRDEAAKQRILAADAVRASEAEIDRRNREDMWTRMRTEIQDLRDTLDDERRAHGECREQLRILDRRVMELERTKL